jgi:hypothetical protein
MLLSCDKTTPTIDDSDNNNGNCNDNKRNKLHFNEADPSRTAAWLVVTGSGLMWTGITCIMFRFVAVAMPHWQLLLSLAFSPLFHRQIWKSVKRIACRLTNYFNRKKNGTPRDDKVSTRENKSKPWRYFYMAHTFAILAAIYGFGGKCFTLYEKRVSAVADAHISAKQDMLVAMSWIETSTPTNAIFTSRMFSAPHIRLIGHRRTTIHPQWEDADIRRRGRLVYPIYSRYSVDVVWNLLHAIEEEVSEASSVDGQGPEHYILVSRSYCRTGTAIGKGLFVDQVTKALKRPESKQKMAFCEAVLGSEGIPYFELVFNAKDIFIMRVNPFDPVAFPDRAFKNVNLQESLLNHAKSVSTNPTTPESRNAVQATISSLCAYADYMITTKKGNPDDMMQLLEQAVRLSVAKGRSTDELLPVFKSCFCLYASQLKRKEGLHSKSMLEYYHLSSVAQISGYSSAYDRRDCINDVALVLDEDLKSPKRALGYYEIGRSLTAGGTSVFLGNFAYAMYLHGNVKFAEKLFMQSLQRAPRNAHNLCGAAIVMWERGRMDSVDKQRSWRLAYQFMTKSHSLDPGNQCVKAYSDMITRQTRPFGV